MVITTRTVRCAVDAGNERTGNGEFTLNISHLVHKIVVSHGAVVQVGFSSEALLLVKSSIVDGETLGILPSHTELYVLPPRLGINYWFDNPKAIRGVHTMNVRHIISDNPPISAIYVFIIEFHGPDN